MKLQVKSQPGIVRKFKVDKLKKYFRRFSHEYIGVWILLLNFVT